MPVRVGMMRAVLGGTDGAEARRDELAAMRDAGLDHVATFDHVSFIVGAGADGIVDASWLLAAGSLPVYVGLYQLPLRHPVPVARQLATVAEVAPGRLVLGVGVGGEDPHEVEICGVDPRHRGRRMDESLTVLRGLMTGRPVTHHGDHIEVDDALILPAPDPPIPIVVGGRSDAAIRRAARLGDGWLGIWVSAGRYGAVVQQIADEAGITGRGDVEWRHGLNLWCGLDDDRDDARAHVASGMQAMYGLPFETFERWSPYGSPEDVAAFLAPYVEAGVQDLNLICPGPDRAAAVARVAEVRRLLLGR